MRGGLSPLVMGVWASVCVLMGFWYRSIVARFHLDFGRIVMKPTMKPGPTVEPRRLNTSLIRLLKVE